MDTTLKSKWLEALRSGKYQQGVTYLKSANNKYCCLGVLCEAAGMKSQLNGSLSNYSFEYGNHYVGGLRSQFLPSTFSIKNGLSSFSYEDLSPNNDSIETHLVNMNDTGKSFNEIADWIEKNVPAE